MPIKKLHFTALFITVVFVASAFGQQTKENQTIADETFKVSITEKKVTETDYESKVELNVNSEKHANVSINVGAAVRAEQITLTLRNIFGDVRFRGSLEKILNQINLLRPPNENK